MRLNLQVVVALMDALDCSADDLIGKIQIPASRRETGTDHPAPGKPGFNVLKEKGFRP